VKAVSGSRQKRDSDSLKLPGRLEYAEKTLFKLPSGFGENRALETRLTPMGSRNTEEVTPTVRHGVLPLPRTRGLPVAGLAMELRINSA